MLVALLEGSEDNLGVRSGNGCEAIDIYRLSAYLGTDVGDLIRLIANKSAQISGAGLDLETKVVGACLSALNHRGFTTIIDFSCLGN